MSRRVERQGGTTTTRMRAERDWRWSPGKQGAYISLQDLDIRVIEGYMREQGGRVSVSSGGERRDEPGMSRWTPLTRRLACRRRREGGRASDLGLTDDLLLLLIRVLDLLIVFAGDRAGSA